MKSLLLVLIGSLGLLSNHTIAAEIPRGNLLELHSCELYAGGCTVSAEATQGGRYMLRVWEFTGGECRNVNLTGLHVALLQSSSDNLAQPNSRFGNAVIYVPDSATAEQKQSLIAWLTTTQPELKSAALKVRSEPLKFERTAKGFRFSAGDLVSVETKPLEKCDARSCGEELWYQPRSATSSFGVAVNQASSVREPLLKLNWNDSAQRSVFLGRFGDTTSPTVAESSADVFCGLTNNFAGYALSPTLVTR